jgi:hypothetical protein
MKNTWLYFGVLIVCLSGCSDGDTPAAIIDPIWVDHGNGIVQFHTNNPEHYNYPIYSSEITVTNNIYEVTVKKISGSDNYGYGMLFCADSNNYYRFFVTTRQRYTIQKFASGEWKYPLISWTTSTKIHGGYNVDNKLKVVRTDFGGTATFDIYINDDLITSINDYTPIKGTKARLAVSVDVEENEKFPYIPVEVWFKY